MKFTFAEGGSLNGYKIQVGKITKGTIVLIKINDEGNIIETRKMQGLTVFARIKSFKGLENKNLAKISEDDLSNFNKLLKLAINDAKDQYLKFKKENLERGEV